MKILIPLICLSSLVFGANDHVRPDIELKGDKHLDTLMKIEIRLYELASEIKKSNTALKELEDIKTMLANFFWTYSHPYDEDYDHPLMK